MIPLKFFGYSTLAISTLVNAAPLYIRDVSSVATTGSNSVTVPAGQATPLASASESAPKRTLPKPNASESDIMKWFDGLSEGQQIGVGIALGFTGGAAVGGTIIGIQKLRKYLARPNAAKLLEEDSAKLTSDAAETVSEEAGKTAVVDYAKLAEAKHISEVKATDLLEPTKVWTDEYNSIREAQWRRVKTDNVPWISRSEVEKALANEPNSAELVSEAKKGAEASVESYWEWQQKYTPPAELAQVSAKKEAADVQIQLLAQAREVEIANNAEQKIDTDLVAKLDAFGDIAKEGKGLAIGWDEAYLLYRDERERLMRLKSPEIAAFKQSYRAAGIQEQDVIAKQARLNKAAELEHEVEDQAQAKWSKFWDDQLAQATTEEARAAIYEERYESAEIMRKNLEQTAQNQRLAQDGKIPEPVSDNMRPSNPEDEVTEADLRFGQEQSAQNSPQQDSPPAEQPQANANEPIEPKVEDTPLDFALDGQQPATDAPSGPDFELPNPTELNLNDADIVTKVDSEIDEEIAVGVDKFGQMFAQGA